MKRLLLILIFSTLFSGCFASASMLTRSPVVGFIGGGCSYPGEIANPNVKSEKRGVASANSLLGLFFWGDASIQAAMYDGQIAKIHHVDYFVSNVLGLYAKFVTIVYGEQDSRIPDPNDFSKTNSAFEDMKNQINKSVCPNCNKATSPDDLFCPFCGEKL